MAPKKRKANPIVVVHNFGGRRATGMPSICNDWGVWDCGVSSGTHCCTTKRCARADPEKTGEPIRHHSYGKTFPWVFDIEEKAYILKGEATLTADDEAKHGPPVKISPKAPRR